MADYYVSQSTGNDAWAGTIAWPWQTLTKVSNEFTAGTFGAGDNIYFMRGDTWTVTGAADRLSVTVCSGAIGNHIYLGPYSSGAQPCFDANGNNTRIIQVTTVHYITIDDLELKDNHDAAMFGIREESHHIVVRDCYLHGTTTSTWAAGLRLNYDVRYIWIENCTVDDIEGEGIYIGRPDVADYSRRVVIKNCTVTNCHGEGLELKDATTSCYVYECHFENNGQSISPAVDWGQVSLGGRFHKFFQCTFKGTATNNRCAIYMGRYQGGSYTNSGRYNTVERCLFEDCTGLYGAIYADGDNNRVINCTFVDCDYGIYSIVDIPGGYEIKNNIFHSINNYPVYLTVAEGRHDFDNNDYSDGSVNVWYEAGAARNFAYVQGLGQEAAGITTGADFAELVTYTLNVTSPCIDAGDITATVYDWNDEYTPANSIDIGWREYGWTSWIKPYRTFKSFFEDALFGRFTGYAGVSLSNTPAPPEGTYSMEVDITDTADRYAYRTGLGYLKHFYANFYVHADDLTMANGDQFDVFQGRTAGNVAIVVVQIYSNFGVRQVRVGLRDDASVWNYTSYSILSAGWNLIEVFWRSAPDTGTNDGEIILWLDEVEMAHSDGFNNHDDTVDRFYVGAVFGLDVGTSGQMYIE